MNGFVRGRRLAFLLLCTLVTALIAPALAQGAGVVNADAGECFSLAVLSDGTLWGWGYNSQGQLGDGTLETHLSPSRVDTGTTWAAVSAGYRHTLALKSDGSLWSWGWNKDGQLGNGHAENTFVPDHWHWRPARVGTGTSWLQVSAGYDHSLALDTSGSVWAWGGNSVGQLGIGSTTPTSVPVLVSASPGLGREWVRVVAGSGLSMAVASDGTLYQWGSNGTTLATTPTSVGFSGLITGLLPTTGAGWLSVSPARDHSSAVLGDSGLWTWTTSMTPEPVFLGWEFLDVAETTDALNLECGLLVKLDHSLWVSTDDYGTNKPLTAAKKFYIVGNALDWTRVAAGADHFLVSKSDGSLWGWGKNTFGQLGDGTEMDRTSRSLTPTRIILPTPIPNVTGMTQSDATDRIVQMGFKVGTITQVATEAVEITRIISQTPAADTLVMPGGTVQIVVSAGPPVPVPNVVGMAQTDAETAIGAVGLVIQTVSQAYSSIVPTGAVISQDPAPGTPVILASKVSLIVSRGRQPKTVPYTADLTELQARASLSANSFMTGSIIKQYSTSVAAGRVIRTSPAAGAQAYVGDTVNIYISLGKPKPSVGNPIAPAKMSHSSYYTVYGYIKPRHVSGTYPVRIYKYRAVSGGWKSYGYTLAKAINYSSTTSKFAARIKLPYKGTWRLRAYAPTDGEHAAAWSTGYDYVKVY